MKPAEYLKQQIEASGMSKRNWYRTIYLHSDHWRDLRATALELAKHRCKSCGCGGVLDVDHIRYRSIYNVTQDDLQVLCRRCHKAEHEDRKDIRQANRKPRRQKSKELQKPVVGKKKSKFQRRRLTEAYNRGKKEAGGEGVNRVAGGYAMVCRVADGLGELSESAKDYIAKIKKSLDDLTAPKKPRGIDGISKLATGIKKLF
jgi:5-methylcytosine-specific restriction protein A